MVFVRWLVLACVLISSAGCGSIASALVDGIFNGILGGSSMSSQEKENLRSQQEQWKGYWQDNPTVNPAMTEAYKDG